MTATTSGGGLFASLGAAMDDVLRESVEVAAEAVERAGREDTSGAAAASTRATSGGTSGARRRGGAAASARAEAAGRGGSSGTGAGGASAAAVGAEEPGQLNQDALFFLSSMVGCLFLCARGTSLLLSAFGLGLLLMTNPVQQKVAPWPLLINVRQQLLAKEAESKSWGAALKTVLVDGLARGATGRRVCVDLKVAGLAFMDSRAAVDQSLVCVGLWGEWHAVVSPQLRAVAAWLAGC